MPASMFPGFERQMVAAHGERISVHVGGRGRPLLLLHGFPQTHATWCRVAPKLAEHFTCLIADLPGYGASSVPADSPGHFSYSKRHMAQLLVTAMEALGHTSFAVLGHDRGARVAYRMALDHAGRVERLGIIEVIPTADMWRAFDADMAMKTYHWVFLAQPQSLPERMIGADPVGYVEWTLRSWTKGGSLEVFEPAALESYREQARDRHRIHAMCEDYRAGYGIDRELDEADRKAGRRIAVPLHFVWSRDGFPARTGDPLALWRGWAGEVTGNAADGGHFLQEENPQAVLDSFVPFLS